MKVIKKARRKSIVSVLINSVLSPLNILCYIGVAILILLGLYQYLFFFALVIPNIVLRTYLDFRANKKVNNDYSVRYLVEKNGKESEILYKNIDVGDVLIVNKPTKILMTGVVIFGNVSVSTACIDGKGNIKDLHVGDEVLAESVIISGNAKIKVTSVSDNTVFDSTAFETKRIKKPLSSIESFLTKLFAVGVIVIALLVIANHFALLIGNRYQDSSNLVVEIGKVVGFYFSLCPFGLLLIHSICLLVSFISLKKKNIAIKELSIVESLNNVDVLCLDKTGTITENMMKVKTIEPLNNSSVDQISQILTNLLSATKDYNEIAHILNSFLKYEPTLKASAVIPFAGNNRYSAATFGSRGTYVLGTIDNLNLINKSGVNYRAEEYLNKGYRIYCLAHSIEAIKTPAFDEPLSAVALIIVEEGVRLGTIEMIKYFRELQAEIKIISGDDALIASELAKSIGIVDAEKHISLLNKSDEEVSILANKYVVFGDASAKQKEIIVRSLQDSKKKVAMIGDGINDAFAIKAANVGLTLKDSMDEIKDISDGSIDFNELKDIMEEGKGFIDRMARAINLYMIKTIFSFMLVSLMILTMLVNHSVKYPISVYHALLLELVTFLISLVMIRFKTNKTSNKYVFKAILKSIFPSLTMIGVVITCFVLLSMKNSGTIKYVDFSFNQYTGSLELFKGMTIGSIQAYAMGFVIVFALFVSTTLFINDSIGKNKWIVLLVSSFIVASLVGITALFTIHNNDESVLFQVGFNYMSRFQWVITLFVAILSVAIYLFVSKIIEVIVSSTNNENDIEEVKENEIKN